MSRSFTGSLGQRNYFFKMKLPAGMSAGGCAEWVLVKWSLTLKGIPFFISIMFISRILWVWKKIIWVKFHGLLPWTASEWLNWVCSGGQLENGSPKLHALFQIKFVLGWEALLLRSIRVQKNSTERFSCLSDSSLQAPMQHDLLSPTKLMLGSFQICRLWLIGGKVTYW